MIELFNILFKWKKPIFIVCLFATILSVVLASLMPNYFKSTVQFIPSNPYMIDRSNMFSKTPGENPVYIFGSGQEIDRFISIGRSQPLRNHVIKKFDLIDHYNIDPKAKLYEFKVNNEFENNFSIIKNALDAVEVSVEDVDPILAANMANTIVEYIDSVHIGIVVNGKVEMANMMDYTIVELKDKLNHLNDSITKTSRYGKKQDVEILKSVKSNLIEDIGEAQVVKEQYLTLATSEISSIYMIQEATPAFNKSRPKRSILILSSLLLTLVVCSIIAVCYEQIKKHNSKEKSI